MFQNPAQNTNQNTVRDAVDAATNALKTGINVAASADIGRTAKATLELGKVLTDASGNIVKIDNAMKNLETAAPGTAQLIRDTASALDKSLKVFPANSVPAAMQPLFKDLESASGAFKKFSEKYDAYQKAPDFAFFSFSTWGAKTGAAREAYQAWNAFKAENAKLEKHLPSILQDPKVQQAGAKAVNDALNILDSFIP